LEIFLAISDPNNHGVEFIHIERKKETGKTDEIEKVLPKPALTLQNERGYSRRPAT